MKNKMTIREVAELHDDYLRQFSWFVGVGIGAEDGDDIIFVYVSSRRHHELDELDEREWGHLGYPVSIQVTGRVRPVGCV